MKNMLLVFAGGGLGSVIRYLVSTLFTTTATAFPYATFIVNIAGSLMIGLLMGLFMKEAPASENWKLFMITGFCGGFTTFSAFSKESVIMLLQQQYNMLAVYLLLTLLLCIGATALGYAISR
ncbi:MAG: fluoride efflux transporter CrcB [Chitinophagaceae bacterium]|nr:fluoride efflux transporter CrcB [Chitinophagaceae bacterium]